MNNNLFHPARRLAGHLADWLPLTWRGLFVALFSGVALWRFGYGTLDLLLFVIGISGLVLVSLSALVIVGAAIYLRRHIDVSSLAKRRLEADSPLRTGFRVPALGALPLLRIGWQWLAPHGVEVRILRRGGWLVEEVVVGQRAQATGICRRFVVGDAFGLTAVTWVRDDPAPLTILPNVGRLEHMPVLQPMASAEGLPHPMGAPEGDRMEIRRYVPGDSVRNILWKTFARTRQLNVRTPEKSIDRARKTVAYLLTGDEDEAASAAARVALESEALGLGWLFGADGTAEPVDSLEPALEAIARSGSYRRNGNASSSGNASSNGNASPNGAGGDSPGGTTAGLSAFLGNQEIKTGMNCIVFAPAHAGEWTTEALALARNFSGAISFVLGTDGVAPLRPQPLWRRLLFFDTPREGISSDELSELLRLFASAGCPAQVVDRVSGRAFRHHREQGLGAVG
ncbi:MAG: DUF58 domain-containing protein [Acidobacteriota bacterium]